MLLVCLTQRGRYAEEMIVLGVSPVPLW